MKRKHVSRVAFAAVLFAAVTQTGCRPPAPPPQPQAAAPTAEPQAAAPTAEPQAAVPTAEPQVEKSTRLTLNVSNLRKIDEVDLGTADPGREVRIAPAGTAHARVEILGRQALTLPGGTNSPHRYVAVRLGAGKGLKAGVPYVLRLEYPEDTSRSYVVWNAGNETRRGFHTGTTLGDALKMPYVFGNPESLSYPLSGKWETWETVFELHPHFPDFPKPGARSQTPENGFWVVVLAYSQENDPTSAGIALGRIALYEAPQQEGKLALPLKRPPEGLPRRHVFWREEMSDGIAFDDKNPAFDADKRADWFEAKMRLAKFLGVDTFSRDLLEFGHNQGWDSSKFGGNDWVYQSSRPGLWSELVARAGRNGLYVLPMYEYCGSMGGRIALGPQKRCKTLNQLRKGPNGRDDYTHIHWSEKGNADVTDPDTLEDLRKIFEVTIADEKANAQFLGAWVRPRNSGMPVSFSDRCLGLFSADKRLAEPATRQKLIADKALYNDYLAWWHLKRRAFFESLRDYLRKSEVVGSDAVFLFTGDPTEPGKILDGGGIVTDDPARFPGEKTVSPAAVLAQRLNWKGLTSPPGTWGGWEWQHSIPANDPQNYKNTPGVMLTMAFSRQYSVSDGEAMESFRTPDGLAMMRHYPLNEHVVKEDDIGYFIADFEEAGPYCVLAEARALANGDPRFIGYMTGNSMQRGFPQYVRAFNRAFLALPALPSVRLAGAASHPDVVVREIKTPKDGTWYAVVNTGMKDAENVRVKLTAPGLADFFTGRPVAAAAPLALYPGQVLVWHAAP